MKFKKNKKINLAWVLGFSVFILVLVLGIYNLFYAYKIISLRISAAVEENLEALSHAHANHITTFIDGKKDRVHDFSFDTYLIKRLKQASELGISRDFYNDISKHIIEHGIVNINDFYELFILDRGGLMLGTTNHRDLFKKDYSSEDYFINALEEVYISDFKYDEINKIYALTISAPMKDVDSGETIGVVGFRLSMSQLIALLKNINEADDVDPYGVGLSGDIYLVDLMGRMITPSRFLRGRTKGVMQQNISTENFKKCISSIDKPGQGSEKSGIFLDIRGEKTIGVNEYIEVARWCLLVEASQEEYIGAYFSETTKGYVLRYFFVLVLFSGCGFFLGRYLDKR